MCRKIIYGFIFLISFHCIKAQQPDIGELTNRINNEKNDTVRLVLLNITIEAYNEVRPDSAYYFGDKLLALSRKLNFRLNEAYALDQMAYALLNMGNYPKSLQLFLSGLAIAEDPRSEANILPDKYLNATSFKKQITARELRIDVLARINHYIGILYGTTNNYNKELAYYLKAKQLTESINNKAELCTVYSTMGRVYISLKKLDSALFCERRAYDLSFESGNKKYLGSILLNFGRIVSGMGDKKLAIEYFKKAIDTSFATNYLRGVVASNLYLSDIYRDAGMKDSALYFANAGFKIAKFQNVPSLLLRSYTSLAGLYKSANASDSLLKYQGLIIKMNDSLFNAKQLQLFQNIDFDEQKRQKQLIDRDQQFVNNVKFYALTSVLAIILLIAFILYRNNQHKQKANLLLNVEKEKVEHTLNELKVTQAQLIQSEKMASLGELTAGIAHEIQNPLNFVNNFSDINKDLIDEMEAEIESKNFAEAKAIAKDVKENEQKINHHGKRAGAIVKGMLQHSGIKTGSKEATDINALADECLRLSYNGLKAKDNLFDAIIKTKFDPAISKIDVNPQDIGKVLLNLYNNAFYSVNEKRKQQAATYEPVVSVNTAIDKQRLSIVVKDNGSGIPSAIINKIFQPFFTTKPTGQGTGLGLSICYDIIKANGGDIVVESNPGDYTSFTISLPVV